MTIQATTWRCSIKWDPPCAHLVLKVLSMAPAQGVTVLLDGVPAKDHSTVYQVEEAAQSEGAGNEVRIAFVPIDGRPPFKRIEIRWEDHGEQRAYTTEI